MNSDKDNQWSNKLTPQQYSVLRKGETEAPFTGKLLNNKKKGVYLCGACGVDLFKSEHKFDSNSGWPSFYDALTSVERRLDDSHNMVRTEVLCQKCQSHLGHVFADSPQNSTNLRYCINSAALKFKNQDNKIING